MRYAQGSTFPKILERLRAEPHSRVDVSLVGEHHSLRSLYPGPVLIGEDCDIGPNCYIRPTTCIGDRVRIGNAVEVKNSSIMSHSKIGHLSYFWADSIIGEGCNFGAGNHLLQSCAMMAKISNPMSKERGWTAAGASWEWVMGDDVMTASIPASIPATGHRARFRGLPAAVCRDLVGAACRERK